MEGWETHKPIVKAILDNFPIQTVLEFGMGYASTYLFLDAGVTLTSVESNQEWVDKLYNAYKDKDNHIIHILNPEDMFLDTDSNKYDLIFVDGTESSRTPCINKSFNKTSIIIAHDTEFPDTYNYKDIKLPDGWVKLDIKNYLPYTSVITNKEQLLKFITDNFKI